MTAAAKTFTDPQLLEGIRQRDNAVLAAVYQKYRPQIAALVRGKNGSEQEAADILQEAVVAVFVNLQNPGFRLTHGFNAYFYGICQNLWHKKFRDKNRRAGVSLDSPEALNLEADCAADCDRAERQLLILEKFKSLPDGCRELLQLAIVEEKQPSEIVAQLGFGSLGYFYKRKSMCKEKLLELVRADAHFDQY